jgi:hypothetical protein
LIATSKKQQFNPSFVIVSHPDNAGGIVPGYETVLGKFLIRVFAPCSPGGVDKPVRRYFDKETQGNDCSYPTAPFPKCTFLSGPGSTRTL